MDLLNIEPHRISYGVKGKHFLFYGPPSTRKTTVGTKFPNALLIATEIGYQFIPNVIAQNVDSWYTFTSVVRELKKPQVRARYDTVVIDTVSLLADMCIKFTCDKLNIDDLGGAGFGKGWTEYRKEFSRQINLIAQLGYGIVFIDHSKESRDEETGAIKTAKPKMDNTSYAIVNALVDLSFFLNKESAGDQGGSSTSVYAYTDLPSDISTKSRARYMSKRFEFTFENLSEELEKAVKTQVQEIGMEIDEEELATSTKPLIPMGDPRSVDEIRDVIMAKGPEIVECGLQDRFRVITTNALGSVKITQAQDIHKDQLLAIEYELNSLLGDYNGEEDNGGVEETIPEVV